MIEVECSERCTKYKRKDYASHEFGAESMMMGSFVLVRGEKNKKERL